jgi:hypothetical protein
MFSFYRKIVCRRIPLLLLVVVVQLVLGRIAAVALTEERPELKIAVAVEGESPLSERYLAALQEIEGLTVIEVELQMDREAVFRRHDPQALAVVRADFAERLEQGLGEAVLFYPAPGIADTSALEELLLTEIVLLRGEFRLAQTLADLGVPPEEGREATLAEADPILILQYEGPAPPTTPLSIPPAWGVPALFLLLPFLHAAQIVPGKDSVRIRLKSAPVRRGAYLCSLASLWLAWGAVVACYLLGMFIFYRLKVAVPIALTFFLLACYSTFLGSIPARLGRRDLASLFFVPWLLLNMTVGGGLWNTGFTGPLTAVLLPVSAVQWADASGSWLPAFCLLVPLAVLLPLVSNQISRLV